MKNFRKAAIALASAVSAIPAIASGQSATPDEQTTDKIIEEFKAPETRAFETDAICPQDKIINIVRMTSLSKTKSQRGGPLYEYYTFGHQDKKGIQGPKDAMVPDSITGQVNADVAPQLNDKRIANGILVQLFKAEGAKYVDQNPRIPDGTPCKYDPRTGNINFTEPGTGDLKVRDTITREIKLIGRPSM